MDEYVGAQLAADQWEMLQEQARDDHPEHENTDPGNCPVCFEEGPDGA